MDFFFFMVNLLLFVRENIIFVYKSLFAGILPAVMVTSKITLALFFLIVIRGAVPRYRYDFLTKLG